MLGEAVDLSSGMMAQCSCRRPIRRFALVVVPVVAVVVVAATAAAAAAAGVVRRGAAAAVAGDAESG